MVIHKRHRYCKQVINHSSSFKVQLHFAERTYYFSFSSKPSIPGLRAKLGNNYFFPRKENKLNKGELDVDASVDMLKDIAGLSLVEQLIHFYKCRTSKMFACYG
jgi:hypothetical protein